MILSFRKLQDNLVDTPPPMYRITGSASEKPHAWVRDPDKSVVLEVIGDVRTIPSGSFATETSLRFPRAKRIRHDKGLRDLTTLEELKEVVTDFCDSLDEEEVRRAVRDVRPRAELCLKMGGGHFDSQLKKYKRGTLEE